MTLTSTTQERRQGQERPIIFSGQRLDDLLDDRKTQTRRLVRLPSEVPDGDWYPDRYNKTSDWTFWERVDGKDTGRCTTPLFRCPYGDVGGRLYVKETTVNVEAHGYVGPVYLASDEGQSFLEYGLGPADDYPEVEPEDLKLRSSMYMPRAMSRITLEITEVRVQRLHEITEADARAEGLGGVWPRGAAFGFLELWASLHGEASALANPWVWAVTFKRVTS